MTRNTTLHRAILAVTVITSVALSGMSLAQHIESNEVDVKELARREIVEKLDNKEASATVLEVTFGPGQKDTLHRHAGPVFGYVLEGEYEHAIDEEPAQTYKAGETFYEPTGCVHRVAANPSNEKPTRLLVVILHPRDVKDVTTWEKDKH